MVSRWWRSATPHVRLVVLGALAVAAVLLVVWLLLSVVRGPGGTATGVTPSGSALGDTVQSDAATIDPEVFQVASTAAAQWASWDSFEYDGTCRGDYDAAARAFAQRLMTLSTVIEVTDATSNLTAENLSTRDPMDNDWGACWTSQVTVAGDPVLSALTTYTNLEGTWPVAVVSVPVHYEITTDISIGDAGSAMTGGAGGPVPGTGTSFSGSAIMQVTVSRDPIGHAVYPGLSEKRDEMGRPLQNPVGTRSRVAVGIETPMLDLTTLPSGVTAG